MDVIVAEATLAGCPVSAHACGLDGAVGAIEAGVTSIEHVYFTTEKMFKRMVEKGVIIVPTLATAEKLYAHRFDQILKNIKQAHKFGIHIVCGGDTGTYSHGENVRNLELMVEAGIPVRDLLESCTVGGWEACRADRCGIQAGWFVESERGDIIALDLKCTKSQFRYKGPKGVGARQ